MEQRTLYEIVGGSAVALVIAGLTYVMTTSDIRNHYTAKVNKMQVELADKDGAIGVLTTKQAALKKELEAEKKVWTLKDDESKKRIDELEKQVKQGVSLEELRIACIEGEITKDIYKKLKKYTFVK